MERQALNFSAFADDLAQGLSDDPMEDYAGSEKSMLLEEVKIGCTMAMLLCLDRDHRMAYIVGEIMELSHREAAEILGIATATFRKRLSRAREDVLALMKSKCGLVNASNACRCRRRVKAAIARGRVDPYHLLFASSEV